MQYILNLTQHQATQEQLEEGVYEPDNKDQIQANLTFDFKPYTNMLKDRAYLLASQAKEQLLDRYIKQGFALNTPEYHALELAKVGFVKPLFDIVHPAALIGGAPYLMSHLEQALKAVGISPLYAYSERVSEEQVQEDGSVRKVNVFKHKGFIAA